MTRLSTVTVLYEGPPYIDGSAWDGGTVALVLHYATTKTADRMLTEMLKLARQDPAAFAKAMETHILRGLSGLGEPGPEHGKRTGRHAGGGTLTKGS